MTRDNTPSSSIVLTGGQVVDPANNRNGKFNIWLENGIIRDCAPASSIDAVPEGADVVDCEGRWIFPGLVDMQVRVGEPVAPHRETLSTLSRAALAGGVTTVLTVPDPVPGSDVAALDRMSIRARDTALAKILSAAPLTAGMEGSRVSDMALLLEAGARAFSDGRRTVERTDILAFAFTYAAHFEALVILHAEDPLLGTLGVMHEGRISAELGLPGIPAVAETVALSRDLIIAEATGASYHAAALSSSRSLDLMHHAKQLGLSVSCGVSINNLMLNENDVGEFRTFLRLSPPLRSCEDQDRLLEAVSNGIIDVMVSDHDPQDVETKRLPFSEAASGAVGLETLLSAGLTFVRSGKLSISRLVEVLSVAPAKRLGLDAGHLSKGSPADITIVDPERNWTVDPARLSSRAKNTPFEGEKFVGKVVRTFVDGRLVFSIDETSSRRPEIPESRDP